MQLTIRIQEKLISFVSDINKHSVIRTLSFAILLKSSDKEVIKNLINLIQAEQMTYMQTYMVTSIEGLLENDQPDQKS